MSSARKNTPVVVATAGILPWQRHNGHLELALVHRSRYDDWSWPKGKLDPGEHWPGAAVRETREEAGLEVQLGVPLPTVSYPMSPRFDTPHEKVIRYWTARTTRRGLPLAHEVDRMMWATPDRAAKVLTYERDRRQLAAFTAAQEHGELDTWPLVVVRHSRALARKHWSKKDWLRPVDARGRRQSEEMVPLLAAYDVRRVVSSSATRCLQTVTPYASSRGLQVHPTYWLSEEGHEEAPKQAHTEMAALFEAAERSLVCSHGPVLPALLRDLCARACPGQADDLLTAAADGKLAKGEVLVAHLRGRGDDAVVVAAERHPPLS